MYYSVLQATINGYNLKNTIRRRRRRTKITDIHPSKKKTRLFAMMNGTWPFSIGVLIAFWDVHSTRSDEGGMKKP